MTEKPSVSTGGEDDHADRQQQKMVKTMKKHLKRLTSRPLFTNAMKTKYPTKMGMLPVSKVSFAGMESALTSVSVQKEKQKLKKNFPKKLEEKIKQK